MNLQDLIGKEIASITTVDESVTYCYHVNSSEYKSGITKKEWTQPTSIGIKFSDGTYLDIDFERLNHVFKEEGAIRLTVQVYEPIE
jgi:hypothetical protein